MSTAINNDKSKNKEILIDDVFKLECLIINQQREQRNKKPNPDGSTPKLGLALSGGGIRSASFAMGVTQALDRYKLFDEVDYLSTVSGGGYLGSAITWFHYQRQKLFNSNEKNTNNPEQIPIFGKEDKGTRPTLKDCEEKGEGEKTNTFLDYIRQHGKYLSPSKHLTSLAMAGQILANSLIAIIVYFSLLLSSMFALVSINFFDNKEWSITQSLSLSSATLLALILIFLGFLTALSASIFSRDKKEDTVEGYKRRIKVQQVYGYLMVVSMFLLSLASMEYLRVFLARADLWISETTGLIPLLIGGAGTLYELVKMRSMKGGKYSNLRIWIVALLLIYGLFYAAYLIAHHFASNSIILIVVFFLVALFVGWLTDINMFGINRTYRDRLMEAFMPNLINIKENKWGPATEADQAMIIDMCGKGVFTNNGKPDLDKVETAGPYHLINTNIVLNDSEEAKYRGRGGDNFILSPAFSGSDSTKWYPTTNFVGGKMSQATAMAISGAALNPGTGGGGNGTTRNKLVSFMMAFFNLRLGWWLPNPNAKFKKKFLSKANFIAPGLTQGVFAFDNKEDSTFIELTDGGHFENTGIYELIRRNVPIIILSQAGADPKFTLEDIGNVMERVKVDFGVKIRFLNDYDLDDVLPSDENSADRVESKFQLSKKAFAVARIDYPDQKDPGYLIAIKALMVRDLPLSLFHYKAAHKDFPNQTTADQSFDESQFEAYRELGYQLTKQFALAVFKKPKVSEKTSLSQLLKWLKTLEGNT